MFKCFNMLVCNNKMNLLTYFITFGLPATAAGTECTNMHNISAPYFEYTSYNNGILRKSTKPVHPKTLEEIQEIVRFALINGYTIKPLGNLFSTTDIICTDGIPIVLSNINHFNFNPSTSLVTIGAGATLEHLLENLHKFGRTINGIPTYSEITIGGAIGTGAHGTNLKHSATLSDDIVSIVIVDGLGKIRNISDPSQLQAFRTHVGLLGILYEVTLSTIPQYKLQVHNYPQPESILWKHNEIMRMARSTDRFQFFWFPTSKQVVLSVGHRVPLSTPGNCYTNFISDARPAYATLLSTFFEHLQETENQLGFFLFQQIMMLSLYQNVPIRKPIFFSKNSNTLCNPAIGFSHLITTNKCVDCPWKSGGNRSVIPFEISVIIPLVEIEGALHTMKNILDEFPVEFSFTGIYFRFLAASDGLLSVNGGRDSVAIDWVLVQRHDKFFKPLLDLPVYQALFQALITKHQGRRHWGKNCMFWTQKPQLLKLYPKLPEFIEQMEMLDPNGVFLNDFGRRLRFGCTKTSMDLHMKHCALLDNCICSINEDCGENTKFCGVIKGYRVCRERSDYGQCKRRIMRNIVIVLFQLPLTFIFEILRAVRIIVSLVVARKLLYDHTGYHVFALYIFLVDSKYFFELHFLN